LPAIIQRENQKPFSSEREILYKILFDMKNDMNDLKKLVVDVLQKGVDQVDVSESNAQLIHKLYQSIDSTVVKEPAKPIEVQPDRSEIQDTEEIVEESLSLMDKEIELIRKALDKHHGKRKYAAEELGISERTLYRKIKEHDIN
ncbi:MAG: sigma-54-dependent Fis family transcriptional regulator, partial [Bacteroidales bacterium]|nr:sigma-54-dependent Fis family transcriptional regulator [Bacteroidales bacterium]